MDIVDRFGVTPDVAADMDVAVVGLLAVDRARKAVKA